MQLDRKKIQWIEHIPDFVAIASPAQDKDVINIHLFSSICAMQLNLDPNNNPELNVCFENSYYCNTQSMPQWSEVLVQIRQHPKGELHLNELVQIVLIIIIYYW